MNAILIVLVPTPEGQPSTEQAGVMPSLEVWQYRIGQDNGNAGLREASNPRRTPPPFWTWFIENPRTCGA